MIFPLFFALIGLAVYGWFARKRWLAVACGSLPCALLTYFFCGIGIAQMLGEGHFYSVPFGGFSVAANDAPLFGSIVFWWIAWSGTLGLLARKL